MHENELILETLCRVSPVSIEVIDIQHKVLACDSGWTAKLLGYTEEEFQDLSRNLFEKIVHPDDRPIQINAYQSLFCESRCPFKDFTIRVQRKDGGYDYVQVRIAVLEVDQQRKPVTFLSMAMDVNELVALKERIRHQVNLLDEISFTNSHELRGPVATILGLIQLLDHEEFENTSVREIIGLLKTTVEKLDSVVHEINQKSEAS